MSATHSLLRAALVFGTTAALAAGTLAGTALADPPTATYPTLAGVGSDTIQDWGHGFANDSAGLIGSYDATPAGTYIATRSPGSGTETFPTIVTGATGNVTLPTGSILRPDGSGAGVSALRASLGDASLTSGNWITQVGARNSFKQVPPGSIDFARSSSGPSAPNANGDLVYIPFAKDAVTWSKKTGDTSLPDNLLKTDLVSLYSCTAVTISGVTYDPNYTGAATSTLKPVRPMVPQAGSGTRTFWGAQLNFPVGAGLLPSCVKDVDSSGTPVQEHNGSALRNNGDIIPFSVPSWIAQSNSASLPGVIDRRNGALLESINAVAPVTAGKLTSTFPILRDMYVVVDWITVQDPTKDLYKAFNLDSGSSKLCDSTQITKYGFGTIAYCGDILTTNRAFDFRPDPTNTATALAASPVGSQIAGGQVTFTATVTPATAPGNVVFKDGTTVLQSVPAANGSAVFNTSSLALGSHSITASFVPTNSILFAASASAAAPYSISTVPAVVTTTTLGIAPVGPQVKGTPVTFTATVSGSNAAGSVVFKNGTATIGTAAVSSGVASFTTSTLAGGNYSVTANFVPTDAALFTPSASAAAAYVISTPTTASLKLAKATSAYGTAAVATVTIAGSGITPAGTVTVKDGATTVGTATLSGGKATIALSKTLAVGTHKLTAVFAGSSIVGASTSAVTTLTVTKAAAAVKVSLTKTSVTYNSTSVKATVAVTAAGVVPTGTVTLKDGAKTIKSVALAGGKATVTLPKNIAVGTHKFQVTYAGNTVVATAKSATATLTVKKVNPTVSAKLAASKINKAARGKVTVTIKAAGVVPTGKVTVKEGSRSLASLTLKTANKGVAAIVLPKLAAGSHKLSVSYAGSTTVAAKAASAVTLTVSK